MVASSRASTTGWRKSAASTRLPTRSDEVTAAAVDIAASGPSPSSKWSGTNTVE